MSLRDAVSLDEADVPKLPPGPPYRAQDLGSWTGRRFGLEPLSPHLAQIHEGGAGPGGSWDNLVGQVRWWAEHPDWMDFLRPDSPVHRDKLMERTLYLDSWADHIVAGARVLDLGGGVGRFTQWLLSRGCEVELADPDLRSLWSAVWHAGGASNGEGKLDVHWCRGEELPPIEPVDVVILAEVLCYTDTPDAVLERVRQVLKPGGVLLASVESDLGWAMSADAVPSTLDALDGDGIVHLAGDRWIQTYDEGRFRTLLSGFEIERMQPSHYVLSGPFETAAGELGVEQLRMWEERLKTDARTRSLNRAWMAVGRNRG